MRRTDFKRRADDNAEPSERLEAYHAETAPLIAFISEGSGTLKDLDAMGEIDAITKELAVRDIVRAACVKETRAPCVVAVESLPGHLKTKEWTPGRNNDV